MRYHLSVGFLLFSLALSLFACPVEIFRKLDSPASSLRAAAPYFIQNRPYGLIDSSNNIALVDKIEKEIKAATATPGAKLQEQEIGGIVERVVGMNLPKQARDRLVNVMTGWCYEQNLLAGYFQAKPDTLHEAIRSGFNVHMADEGLKIFGRSRLNEIIALPDWTVSNEKIWNAFENGELDYLIDRDSHIARKRFLLDSEKLELDMIRPFDRAVLFAALRGTLISNTRFNNGVIRHDTPDFIKRLVHHQIDRDVSTYVKQHQVGALKFQRTVNVEGEMLAKNILEKQKIHILAQGDDVYHHLSIFEEQSESGHGAGGTDMAADFVGRRPDSRFVVGEVKPGAISNRHQLEGALLQIQITRDYIKDKYGPDAKIDNMIFIAPGHRSNKVGEVYQESNGFLTDAQNIPILIEGSPVQVVRLPERKY